MFNQISTINELMVTASTTLGYGPGQQVPPLLLIANSASPVTITLPPTTSYMNIPPTQQTVGIGGGSRITIFNANGAAAVSLVAVNSETIVPAGTSLAAAANGKLTLQACPGLAAWYVVA